MGAFQEEKRETCMRTTCLNPGINSWEDTHSLSHTHTGYHCDLCLNLAQSSLNWTVPLQDVHIPLGKPTEFTESGYGWGEDPLVHTHTYTHTSSVLESSWNPGWASMEPGSPQLHDFITSLTQLMLLQTWTHFTIHIQVVQSSNCEMVKSWI